MVVSAELDDSDAEDAGRVYVYNLASATPTVPAFILKNPNPAGSDNFGYGLAISGTRVVVGAPYDNSDGPTSGIAYVYELNSATPDVPSVTLRIPSPVSGELFGYAGGISGPLVVIGAAGDDPGASDAGSAFVYDLSSPTPTTPGVAGALQDPTLQLVDNSGNVLRENDNWEDTQRDEIEETTIPPSDPAESAIVLDLPSGNYTAVVRGKDEGTGVGLVELYNLR